MFQASKIEYANTVQLLIENGANNFNDSMIAAASNSIEIVKIMLENEADSYTASIIETVKSNQNDIVNLLSEVSPDSIYQAIMNVIKHNRERNNLVILKTLLNYLEFNIECYNKIMKEAALYYRIDIVQLMFSVGANDFDGTIGYIKSHHHINEYVLELDEIIVKQLNELKKYGRLIT